MWRRDGRRNGSLWFPRSFRFRPLISPTLPLYSVRTIKLYFPLHIYYGTLRTTMYSL